MDVNKSTQFKENVNKFNFVQSPDSCSICLSATLIDRSLLYPCSHEFCFGCIEQWSKVKNICPLCNRMFTSILHNIKSDSLYDVQHVPDADHTYSDWFDESGIITMFQAVVRLFEIIDIEISQVERNQNTPGAQSSTQRIQSTHRAQSPLNTSITPSIQSIQSIPSVQSIQSITRIQSASSTQYIIRLQYTSSTQRVSSVPRTESTPSTENNPSTSDPSIPGIPAMPRIPSIPTIPDTSGIIENSSENDCPENHEYDEPFEWDIFW